MNRKLTEKAKHRGCGIEMYEMWNCHEFDGIGYSYVIINHQGVPRTDQTDEYWIDSVSYALTKAIASIDEDLDSWWAISCLAMYRNKFEHFALVYFGEETGAIAKGMEELQKRYPKHKYSVKILGADM
jgi:hypothetical protein